MNGKNSQPTALIDTVVLMIDCSDPNCGDAYDAAVDDTAGGLVAGCSQANPSSAVSAPTASPSCS